MAAENVDRVEDAFNTEDQGNPDWKAEVLPLLGIWAALEEEARDTDPPIAFQETHRQVERGLGDMADAGEIYREGVVSGDLSSIPDGNEELQAGLDTLTEALESARATVLDLANTPVAEATSEASVEATVIATSAPPPAVPETDAESRATPAIATPSLAPGMTTLSGTVTANGSGIFLWLRDQECVLSFAGYDPSPEITILDTEGRIVSRTPLRQGTARLDSMTDRALGCTVPFTVAVPSQTAYTVVVDPYFDAARGPDDPSSLEITLSRDADEPVPLIDERLAGPLADGESYLVAGSLELRGEMGEEFLVLGPLGCSGLRGYEDIEAGVQVRVTNETGQIIAVSNLEPLIASDDECRFTFTSEVSRSAFYTFSIVDRGEVTYSHAEMEELDWNVAFIVG